MAVADGRETCLGPGSSEFAVKYLKGRRGFDGKMDGVLVLAGDRVCFRNRRGDREFTIVRESAQAHLTLKPGRNIGCWFGAATLALGTGMVDPDQLCRRIEYRVEVETAAPDGPERIIFKPAKAEASALVAAINHRAGRAGASPPGDGY